MPFDMTLDPTTDVILGAIDYLERYGWRKGGAASDGKRCILGALRAESLGKARLFSASIRRVKAANGIEIDLPFWNDAQKRTKEDVISALRNTLAAPP